MLATGGNVKTNDGPLRMLAIPWKLRGNQRTKSQRRSTKSETIAHIEQPTHSIYTHFGILNARIRSKSRTTTARTSGEYVKQGSQTQKVANAINTPPIHMELTAVFFFFYADGPNWVDGIGIPVVQVFQGFEFYGPTISMGSMGTSCGVPWPGLL